MEKKISDDRYNTKRRVSIPLENEHTMKYSRIYLQNPHVFLHSLTAGSSLYSMQYLASLTGSGLLVVIQLQSGRSSLHPVLGPGGNGALPYQRQRIAQSDLGYTDILM